MTKKQPFFNGLYDFVVLKLSKSRDANAEYIGFVRKTFEEKGIAYQNGEMGKIGVGGGGTIAYILADRGMNVVDCGLSLLSMHSPYEITSKFDLYNAYLGYQTFYQNAETFKD